MELQRPTLLDEALGGSEAYDWKPLRCKTVFISDRVETSGSFLLHQLIKRALLSQNDAVVVILLAFAHPFSHYDRVLRKLGCNLIAQRDNKRFIYFDLRTLNCSASDETQDRNGKGGLDALYGKIQSTVYALPENMKNHVTVMIDDVSLMEVATNGSSDLVLDFLHYCDTLLADSNCSLIALNHEDIYSSMERPSFILQMDYVADVLIKVEPLSTGLAADVHGQLTVMNRGISSGKGTLENKTSNFHFRVKENNVEYFYPGSRT